MNAAKNPEDGPDHSNGEFRRCCRAIDGYLQKAEQARVDLLLQYDAKRLHTWRVNLRRVTATLDKLIHIHAGDEATALLETLKQHRDATGSSRDLDILAEETLPAFATEHPGSIPTPALWQKLEQQRNQARRDMLDALREHSLAPWIADFNAWSQKHAAPSDKTLRHAASAAIESAHRKLYRRADKLDGGREPLHRMRTATKKLRYTIELFQHAFPHKAANAWLEALTDLQAQLGKAHDRMTGRNLGSILLADQSDEKFIKQLRRWSKRTAHRATIHADTSYKQLSKLEPYWRA